MANPTGKVAILIVNGGHTTSDDRWIRLCLERIARFTVYPNYHIYLWNNRLDAPQLDTWLLARPRLTLLTAAPYEQLHHPHRTPLQRLYHQAKEEGARYIVTMDSDAHPLKAGWLTTLLAALDAGAALAGVWRDEMASAIRPYVHPSCLCTTVDFVERHQLRFDFNNTRQPPTDTLSHFTWVAEAEGLPIHKLMRSNRRFFHYLMGGIYGDLIYHHAAASRASVSFHNAPRRGRSQSIHYVYLRNTAADLLFNHYEACIGWLQGENVDSKVATQLAHLNAKERDRNLALALSPAPPTPDHPALGQRIKRRLSSVLRRSRLAARIVNTVRHAPRTSWPAQNDHQSSFQSLFAPFQRKDLAPLPAHGWTTGPPDFVGVGASKCGTTWWYQLMLQHPQIVDNRGLQKELQYLLHFQYHTIPEDAAALYREGFATAPGTVCGEFSAQYLAYPLSLEQLALVAPETRLLVILRNPIDRFISHLNHLITNRGQRYFANLEPHAAYLLRNYSFYTEAMLPSHYSIGMAQLFRFFDRERVLVLQFERLVQSPAEELARTYRFLGVDDRFRPKVYHQPVNQGSYVIPKPDAAERARLAAYLKADVQRTATLCPEIDLGLWPDFNGA